MKNKVIEGIVALLLLFVAFFVISNVVTGYNVLGGFSKYLAIGGFLLGLVRPKIGFWLAFLSMPYLDTLKRLLITGDHIGRLDLYFVLGIAPLTVLGTYLGGWIRITTDLDFRRRWMKLYFAAGLIACLFAAPYISSDRGIADLANAGVYLLLLAVIPSQFLTSKAALSLPRAMAWLFLPVALYLFWQLNFGLADFEYDYMLTGLSIESRNMVFGMSSGVAGTARYFSTMNSAANVSTALSVMAALSLLAFPRRGRVFGAPLGIVLFLIFAAAAFFTYSRGGWICGLATLTGGLAFRHLRTTQAIYGVGAFLVILIFVSSPFLLKAKVMSEIESKLVTKTMSEENRTAATLGTFNARLQSMRLTMIEPRRWRPFGILIEGVEPREMSYDGAHGPYFSHDGLSSLLMRAGYIPLGFALILVVVALKKIHGRILRIGDRQTRLVAAHGMAGAIGICVGMVGNGAQLITFPINFLFALFLSVTVLQLYRWERMQNQSHAAQKATDTRPAEDAGSLGSSRSGIPQHVVG